MCIDLGNCRGIRFAVTLLILGMAVFVSAESSILPNVHGSGVLYLHGGQGNPDTDNYSPSTYGHAFTGGDVGVFGSLTSDTPAGITACTISGSIINPSCSITSGFGTSSVTFNGTFTVGNVAPGDYLIQVSANAGTNAVAQATLVVDTGPVLQLNPSKGPVGTSVQFNATWLQPSDTTCTVGSPTSGFIVSPGCSTFAVQNATGPTGHRGFFTQNATGSFIVGNIGQGQYVVRVTGSSGDFAEAVFNVTSGPFIQFVVGGIAFPIGKTPSVRTGTHVDVEGSSFLVTDTTCTISSPTLSYAIQGSACSVFTPISGRFQGFTNVTASFNVWSVPPGQYVIRVTGNQGDFAEGIINVTVGPRITLSPASGRTGTHVLVNGTGFLPTDTSCTISSPTWSGLILQGACSINAGSQTIAGSFFVGNIPPGQYVVEVTGCPGNTGCTPSAGDFATAIFNVTLGPRITLSRGTASPGLSVNVNGTGFLPTDTSCSISSPGSDAVVAGSAACVKQAGSTITSGSFIVGNVLPGQYVIEVTGCQGNNGCTPSAGDFAQAVLNVTGGPRLTLTPTTGTIGTSITISGTGFLTTDQSCSISSISSPNPILVGSAACATTVGTGVVSGSFIVGNVPAGEYVIEVTGCLGNNGCAPSVGDFAQTVLAVVSSAGTLTLFPSNATEGSTVLFAGSGLSPSDTACTLLAYNHATNTLDTNLITSPTCSITTPGMVHGTFVVSPFATTNIQWNLTVRGTPVNDRTSFAIFNVTADVVVTPTSGTIHTVFTFTGSGFSSLATACNATIVPPFPSGSNAGCYISAGLGQVSGSVVAPTNTIPGTYAIYVTDNTGKRAAGVFTVGTPSALVVVNPASVNQGQPVGVAGFGFNPNDTFCTISSPSGAILFSGTPTCIIAGGYASGAFTVSATAPGGYYLIVVRACSTAPVANVCTGTALDFASNFLGVNLASTITTFSTTTTTASTTTSLSTTTTSVATTFSFSSTTYSTTGILFTTYTHLTLTTVSGQTTTAVTSTTSTTQTQTTVTVSTTTQFTTVPCGPLPCGFAVQAQPQGINPAPGIDSSGLIAALLLLLPMLLRRLLS